MFAAALILYNAAWLATYPMILGAAFAVDSSGQLSIRATGTWLLAQSAGVLAAGAIAQIFGKYTAIGPIGLAFCIVAIIVILPLVSNIDGGTGRIRMIDRDNRLMMSTPKFRYARFDAVGRSASSSD